MANTCRGTSRPCTVDDQQCQNGGICCQYSEFKKRCQCAPGYRGVQCDDVETLAISEERTSQDNILIFGVILGLVAVILTVIVVYIVIRMMRRRNVQVVIIEDDGEPCSPLITDADIAENDGMDSVVIVRNHSVRSHTRYSRTTSYCCNPSHNRESGQFSLSPVPTPGTPGARPCQFTKQGSTYHGHHTVLQTHAEEDEGEENGIRGSGVKPIDAITKL